MEEISIWTSDDKAAVHEAMEQLISWTHLLVRLSAAADLRSSWLRLVSFWQ